MKDKINFGEFLDIESKLEITVGYITEAIRIPKKDKLIQLTVEFEESIIKTVVTNLGESMQPDEFLHITALFVTNLEPSKIGGVLSEAMILGATDSKNKTLELNTEFYNTGTKLF